MGLFQDLFPTQTFEIVVPHPKDETIARLRAATSSPGDLDLTRWWEWPRIPFWGSVDDCSFSVRRAFRTHGRFWSEARGKFIERETTTTVHVSMALNGPGAYALAVSLGCTVLFFFCFLAMLIYGTITVGDRSGLLAVAGTPLFIFLLLAGVATAEFHWTRAMLRKVLSG